VQQPRLRPRVAQQLRDERRQPPRQRLRDPKDGTSEQHFSLREQGGCAWALIGPAARRRRCCTPV
jgi:hypothetical protein